MFKGTTLAKRGSALVVQVLPICSSHLSISIGAVNIPRYPLHSSIMMAAARGVEGEAQNQRSESAGSGRSIILSPDEPVSTVNPMPEHLLYHVLILGDDLFDIQPGL